MPSPPLKFLGNLYELDDSDIYKARSHLYLSKTPIYDVARLTARWLEPDSRDPRVVLTMDIHIQGQRVYIRLDSFLLRRGLKPGMVILLDTDDYKKAYSLMHHSYSEPHYDQ